MHTFLRKPKPAVLPASIASVRTARSRYGHARTVREMLQSQRGGESSASSVMNPDSFPPGTADIGRRLDYGRFAGNPRLEAAYENAPPMRKGEVGEAVALVQEALVDDGFVMPISTLENGEMDGIFGSETFRTVWGFQRKHALDTDGVVGHDTLDELQVVEENDEEKPEIADVQCSGVQKFGIDIAGSMGVVLFKHFPAADTRSNSPGDIMYRVAGRHVKNTLFEIKAIAIDATSFAGGNPGFQHGVIQTARSMRYDAAYSGGHKAHRVSTNSRDAESIQVTPPWVRSSGAKGSPVSLGSPYELVDAPRNHFPKVHPNHPGSDLQKITFKTVLDFWHVAKDPASDGTQPGNLAFLSHFQITSESKAVKSTNNNNFVGSAPNNRISQPISCGKGGATPVLNTPVTIDELQKLHA